MLHPRGDFLPYIAPLAKINPVQALESGFQNITLVFNQFRLGDNMLNPQRLEMVVGQRRNIQRPVMPPAHRPVARVLHSARRQRTNAAPDRAVIGPNSHIGAQPIHVQPLRQCRRAIGGDIQQHPIAVSDQEKIKQVFALRAQQGGINRAYGQLVHIVADQPLQKAHPVSARNAQQLPRFIMVSFGHAVNIGANLAIASPKAAMSAPISVIIPTLNAAAGIGPTLAALAEGLDAGLIGELIIVDGGSDDAIETIADQIGARFLRTPPGRGGQLKQGAALATRPWLLFIHADTVLAKGWVEAVKPCLSSPDTAGYFWLRFDATGIAPHLVAGWANLRSRWFGLPYGDQALLLSRRLYDRAGGYPDIPLMEDVALARHLRGHLQPIAAHAVTSAARYNGQWLRRGVRNLLILLRYFMGADPKTLARTYRKQP